MAQTSTDRTFTAAALIPDDHFTLTHEGRVITDTVIETHAQVRENLTRIDTWSGSTYTVPVTTPVTVHN